jgi:hypothetical protein
MSLLTEGQTDEAYEPSQKCSYRNRRALADTLFFKGEKYVTVYSGLPVVLYYITNISVALQ